MSNFTELTERIETEFRGLKREVRISKEHKNLKTREAYNLAAQATASGLIEDLTTLRKELKADEEGIKQFSNFA